jgi:hypothetical protein
VGSQAKFLESQKNGCRVTHLFRYEDQKRLKTFLEERLEVTLNLEQRNVSPAMELHLGAGAESKLRRKHAAEFALYDTLL